MADARDPYDAMLKADVAAALAELGFKRRRNSFLRFEHGAWQLIDFQASQFGSRADVRFTVNLAVAYLAARDESATWDDKKAPTEGAVHVRTRIGELTPSRSDTWWEVNSETDTEALASELIEMLRSLAVPWLDSRATVDDLVASIRANPVALNSFELAHIGKTLVDAGEFAAADLVREEQRRRQPGRSP